MYSSGVKRLESSVVSKEERFLANKNNVANFLKRSEFSFTNNFNGDQDLVSSNGRFKFYNRNPTMKFDEIEPFPDKIPHHPMNSNSRKYAEQEQMQHHPDQEPPEKERNSLSRLVKKLDLTEVTLEPLDFEDDKS